MNYIRSPGAWAILTTEQRTDHVLAMLAERPAPSYADIAAQLGTTKAAIGAIVYRAGVSHPNAALKAIGPSVAPVLKALFTAVSNSGISDATLAKRSGYSTETIWSLRTGVRGGKLQTVLDIAAVVGLELVVRPRQ